MLLVWTSLVGMRRAPTIVAPRRCKALQLESTAVGSNWRASCYRWTVQLSLPGNQPRFCHNSVTVGALLGAAGGWIERKNKVGRGFSSTLDTLVIISHCTKKVPLYKARNRVWSPIQITRRVAVVQLCSTHLRPVKENDVIVEWMGRYLSSVYRGCQMDKQSDSDGSCVQ